MVYKSDKSQGLGGTSLINANVFMEADDQTLGMNMWPPEIRDDVEGFKKCKFVRLELEWQHLLALPCALAEQCSMVSKSRTPRNDLAPRELFTEETSC